MATYSITINRAARTLTVFKNGQWYKSYPIAVGKPTDSIPHKKESSFLATKETRRELLN